MNVLLCFILFYECFVFFSDKSYCIMGESDLEDSATHPFDPEEWIGKGRKLPSPNDRPQGLRNIFTHSRRYLTRSLNVSVDEEMDDEGK